MAENRQVRRQQRRNAEAHRAAERQRRRMHQSGRRHAMEVRKQIVVEG